MSSHVKTHANPVDSLFALENLDFNEPFVSDSHCSGCVNWRLLNEFHIFFLREGELGLSQRRLLAEFHAFSRGTPILWSIPRALATRCSHGGGGGGELGRFYVIFRTPSGWTLGAGLAATFSVPRWPAVAGR